MNRIIPIMMVLLVLSPLLVRNATGDTNHDKGLAIVSKADTTDHGFGDFTADGSLLDQFEQSGQVGRGYGRLIDGFFFGVQQPQQRSHHPVADPFGLIKILQTTFKIVGQVPIGC